MRLKNQCLLGIEASGFYVSVGLAQKGTAVGSIFLNTGAPNSQTLMTAIDQLLKMTSADKEDLEGVCVTLGPGSFTSLRISLSTAEALGMGLDIPVYGVDNLLLIAASVPFYPFPVKVVQNAYKGEFYTASYDASQGAPKAVDEIRLITPGNFYEDLRENDLILGNGVDILLKDFNLEAKKARALHNFQRMVSGVGVIEHFLEREAEKPAKIPLEPIYIRLSDAELNYSRQFGDQ